MGAVDSVQSRMGQKQGGHREIIKSERWKQEGTVGVFLKI